MSLKAIVGLGLVVLTSFVAQAGCLDNYNAKINSLRTSAEPKRNGAALLAAVGSSTATAGYLSVFAVPPVAIAVGGTGASAAGLAYSSSNDKAVALNLVAVRDLILEGQVGTGLNLIAIAEKSNATLEFVSNTVNDLDSKNAFCPNGDLLTAAQSIELVTKQMEYGR